MAITIDYDKCCYKDGQCVSGCDCGSGCAGCVSVCAMGALTKGELKLEIDPAKCIDCGACVSSCKQSALSL